ncbi:HAD family hydrolase [Halapricum desulfuricans]|uniref:HAD superfamily hydrolase n=1 Tax=Halapricum desulfuricans TaxID=2841257 RepID=A0A897NMU2_9EURY|nr:HAD family hydrolase [Halapricum desulfuricans]QSG15850.1 HAD superfamily hydrolase [Halapricum desulfuricans]
MHAGSHDAVSFDCFGTLLSVDQPDDPAAAIAESLASRGIERPDDWERAYATPHQSVEPGREQSLVAHVSAALSSRGIDPPDSAVRDAVLAAFESPVRTRDGAGEAVAAAEHVGSVGVCSNCSVPGLVERSLERSALGPDRFDAVVTSVGCGWRKPDRRAFEAVADALGTVPADLLHVGDDPETDWAAPESVLLSERSLSELAGRWRGD